ncbi:hypothetical protein [Bradyrhizobium diazoefficiens]|uniref:hypothetical protein n=1 Tax=Bradyrhizobium diazoefficiens TaxID=1355477 RepID=UPI001B6F8C2E|nr:hypothetical protein [Bradyrhizobium japonicum]
MLDWASLDALPATALEAARMYARHKIPLWAPPTVRGLFFMYELLNQCPSVRRVDGVISFATFEELRADGRAGGPELTRFRAWYDWAATLELPGFDRNSSDLLNVLRIGANPQHRPARKKDPELGPLSDTERQELFEKTLEASDDDLPLMEKVAVLLGMALGANAGPMSLLQVQDFGVRSSGSTAYPLLEVPRHKKGFEQERADFRTRPLERRWASYLERLIARNRARADEIYLEATGQRRPAHVAVPVFMRERIRTDLEPAMAEYSLHITERDYSTLLRRAAKRLKVKSRHGGVLRLNARRLRSTFATNLIADGKSRGWSRMRSIIRRRSTLPTTISKTIGWSRAWMRGSARPWQRWPARSSARSRRHPAKPRASVPHRTASASSTRQKVEQMTSGIAAAARLAISPRRLPATPAGSSSHGSRRHITGCSSS